MVLNWKDAFFEYSKAELSSGTLTPFVDKTGFSYVGEYDSSQKRQMGVSKEVDIVPLFRFYFSDSDEIESDKYMPLTVDVAFTSRVVEGKRMKFMLNDSRVKRLKPIDFSSTKEFYVNAADGKLYKKSSQQFKKIEIRDLYKRLYAVHSSSVYTVKGIYRRLKILTLRFFPSRLFFITSRILGALYWFIRGKFFKYDVYVERYLDKKDDSNLEAASMPANGSIDFFGYKVSIWTLFTYSLIVVFTFMFYKDFLVYVFNDDSSLSAITSIALAIITIVTYDKLLPFMLEIFIKYSSTWATDIRHIPVKLKI